MGGEWTATWGPCAAGSGRETGRQGGACGIARAVTRAAPPPVRAPGRRPGRRCPRLQVPAAARGLGPNLAFQCLGARSLRGRAGTRARARRPRAPKGRLPGRRGREGRAMSYSQVCLAEGHSSCLAHVVVRRVRCADGERTESERRPAAVRPGRQFGSSDALR